MSCLFDLNCSVDCCEMRGLGIQLSKLIVDNVKGKQLSSNNNTLLNFVSRHAPEKPAAIHQLKQPEVEAVEIPESVAPPTESPEEESVTNRSYFELPSATQIDSNVFDELPDDVKNDIRKEYQRKGISIRGITRIVESEPDPDIVPKATKKSPENVPVSYEGIRQVISNSITANIQFPSFVEII